MEFKEYKKSYEDVFTSKRILNRCKISDVSNSINIEESNYRGIWKKLFRWNQEHLFEFLIKYYWLSRKFCYKGFQAKQNKGNGRSTDRAFGTYIRHFVGFDNRIYSQSLFYTRVISSYLKDFFPNINKENPFEKIYKYPYKYMNFDCLTLVYKMPERLNLLELGEKRKMKYTEFIDYVYNYVSSYNEEIGKQVFGIGTLFTSGSGYPLIKYYEEQRKKIKTSDIPEGDIWKLLQSESLSAESPVKGFTSNSQPYKLRDLVGVKTVAEVYRTLDKLAIRKEYHNALIRHGVDLDSIVQGIKEVSQTDESAAIRLKAYQTLLKSLGLDEYKEKDGEGGKGWEDIVMKSIDKEETKKLKAVEVDEYEVIEPIISEESKQKQKEEKESGEQLYEK